MNPTKQPKTIPEYTCPNCGLEDSMEPQYNGKRHYHRCVKLDANWQDLGCGKAFSHAQLNKAWGRTGKPGKGYTIVALAS